MMPPRSAIILLKSEPGYVSANLEPCFLLLAQRPCCVVSPPNASFISPVLSQIYEMELFMASVLRAYYRDEMSVQALCSSPSSAKHKELFTTQA